MAELIPTRQARNLVDGLTDYLTTTFALKDPNAQAALSRFLTNKEEGMFRGPYIRTRLPFAPARDGWRDLLDFYPAQWPPYGHQARAFERLSSKGGHRPQPTLVTTGTGSGKTEAFLYPVLDHVVRARRDGITGIKALLLYPMNALANDQSQRIDELLSSHAELSGVRVGLYTGEAKDLPAATYKKIITHRDTMESNPPDILLTNYKMLDQMFLRQTTASMWKASTTSLQYLVLDEFHTYDGAQGTDVAMLLRRLGTTLKSYWPKDLTGIPHGPTEDDRALPLGRITPVATSATLGGSGGASAMAEFAETIFGDEFDDEAIVTESRMSFADWAAEVEPVENQPAAPSAIVELIPSIEKDLEAARTMEETISLVVPLLYEGEIANEPEILDRALRHHPLTQELADLAAQSIDIDDLVKELLPVLGSIATAKQARTFVSALIGVFSHVRAKVGRSAMTIDVHMWIRELSRIDSEVSRATSFRWSDDGVPEHELEGDTKLFLPAIYCRHCGRTGWGSVHAAVEDAIKVDPNLIRQTAYLNPSNFRALMAADVDDVDAIDPLTGTGLTYLNTADYTISPNEPDGDSEVGAAGLVIPVLQHVGHGANERSAKQSCPSCQTDDGIRFIGSAIATLTSVAVTDLFGTENLDEREKKALVFTDSVQDAAHRAGFIQARSHTFNLRTTLRSAFRRGAGDIMSLTALIDSAIVVAEGEAPAERYKLIPPDLTEREGFREFWEGTTNYRQQATARTKVRNRLLFDAIIEFGLSSGLGRTLELTGTVVAENDIASMPVIVRAMNEAWDDFDHLNAELQRPTLAQFTSWIRGIVIRMRKQGGIYHDWLKPFITEGGRRYFVWGGRRRWDGMPAFPAGRATPTFPTAGRLHDKSELTPLYSRQGWYVDWTSRILGVSRDDAAHLLKRAFAELVDMEVIREVRGKGTTSYAIDPDNLLLFVPFEQDLLDGKHSAECSVCNARTVATATVIDELEGNACLERGCTGTLERSAMAATNFYREFYQSNDAKRVVAREHSAVLDTATRLDYEDGFKKEDQKPNDPNVLVATPTLEMGIDIGDLSCVMLGSMPRSVASYVQRVGRAGRQTGNSLIYAFVRGRGEHLPKLYDPLSVINGDVTPPLSYLEAEEILRRQFTAFCGDILARDTAIGSPQSARDVLGSIGEGTYLGRIIEMVNERGANLVDEFTDQFGDLLSAETVDSLRAWVTDDLERVLTDAHIAWQDDQEALRHRISDMDEGLLELKEEERHKLAISGGSNTEEIKELRQDIRGGETQVRRLRKDLADRSQEYWISGLERYSLLPNYTLVGDSVDLEVGVSWRDEITQEFDAKTYEFSRSASSAIHELAPGNTFYAQGMEIAIDALDLGPDSRNIEYWQICPRCGWINPVDRGGTGGEVYSNLAIDCARCGQGAINDTGNVFQIHQMKKVTAEIRRDESVITDSRDDRRRSFFNVPAVADLDPRNLDVEWYVDSGFGVEFMRRVDVTWLNLGNLSASGTRRTIVGREMSVAAFKVCRYCGKLDQQARENSKDEHRFWCKYRNADTEDVVSLVLARQLRTQGAVLHLPMESQSSETFAIPTLSAALLLGLYETVGGVRGQLDIIRLPRFDDGQDRLLVHDTVPGGTGYLAVFKDHVKVRAALQVALDRVKNCSCRNEDRRACHRCLLPYAPHGQEDSVSRAEAERILTVLIGEKEWRPTEDPGTAGNEESALEVRFRQVFRSQIETATDHFEVLPPEGRGGERYRFRIGTHRWKLDSQVDIYGTRPDFVLTPGSPALPRIAIYIDSLEYHATPRHNRLADDARKRARLRNENVIPWAITDADISLFAEADRESRAIGGFSSVMEHHVMANYSPRPDLLNAIKRGSMHLLWEWIKDPNLSEWRKLSTIAPILVSRGFKQGAPTSSSIEENLISRLFVNLTDKDHHWWDFSYGAFTGVTMAETASFLTDPQMRTLLVIDDSRQRMERADFADDWRNWLAWSNLTAFAEPMAWTGAIAATTSSLSSIVDDLLAIGITARETTRGNVPAEGIWQEIFVDLDGDEGTELARILMEAGACEPEFGEEFNGFATFLAWPDRKVAVVYTPDDQIEFETAGWSAYTIDTGAFDDLIQKVKI